MARSLSRRGRMRSDDERRMQINSLFIEHEVEAKDLAGVLYASQIIDGNDRDEILGGSTRLERTRRMIDILLLRGHEAFDVFLRALDDSGYDHVATRLRTTEVQMTPKTSLNDLDSILRDAHVFNEVEPVLRETSSVSVSSRDPAMLSHRLRTFEATCLSLPAQEPGNLTERLKKIEDLWDILSRRVTRIERRVEPPPSTYSREEEGEQYQLGEGELQDIKKQLAEIKTDTLAQVQELTSANVQKATMIGDLVGEVEDKTAQLQEAQNRIEELEQRIAKLEAEKAQSLQEVSELREELHEHREHVKHQEDWFNAENLRMKNKLLQQDKVISQQEAKVDHLQEEEQHLRQLMEDQQQDLKEQRRLMEQQSHQLGVLTKHIMTIATTSANNSNNNNTTSSNTSKNNSNAAATTNSNNTKKETTDVNTAAEIKAETKPPENKAPRFTHSDDSDSTMTTARDDLTADITVAVPLAVNANQGKPHTAHAGKNNLNKNQFNNHYHRTSFNAFTSGISNNSTVCLNVPASANPANMYRGSKRSAPAPNFRGYNRRK